MFVVFPGIYGVSAGGPGNGNVSDGESRYFSEVLSARISKHSIFTDMKFWQHVLKEAVQAKTEKVRLSRVEPRPLDGG